MTAAALACTGCGPESADQAQSRAPALVLASPSATPTSAATRSPTTQPAPGPTTGPSRKNTARATPSPSASTKTAQAPRPAATTFRPAPVGSTMISFGLHGPERIPNDVGFPNVEVIDQEGCGIYDQVGIFARVADRRTFVVKVKYHVDSPQPIPDGSFELGYYGTGSQDHVVYSGGFGPLPQLDGNEDGGDITFTVRAVYQDAATPTPTVYTKRYFYPLDGCPGHPEPTPR